MAAGFKSKPGQSRIFSRPSTDATVVTREWRTVGVQDLKPNDLVANRGLVISVRTTQKDAEVVLEVGSPVSKTFSMNYGDQLFAFVEKESE